MAKTEKILVEEYIKGFGNQDVYWLSKAITLVESRVPEHQYLARELLKTFLPQTGTSRRIGITGPPGSGKSSLINVLCQLIVGANKSVAVLSVDPSSSSTGGSLLGDKVRMQEAQLLKHVFIRPSPAGEVLGGLTRSTYESLLLCEAFGFDYVLVESVGVGQSEISLQHLTDVILLLIPPAAGDEIQGIKRGVLEIADGIFVNKEDLDPDQALETQLKYENGVGLVGAGHQWVKKGAVTNRDSIVDLWTAVNETWDGLENIRQMRDEKKSRWMDLELKEELLRLLAIKPNFQASWHKYKTMVLDRELTSYEAIDLILQKLTIQDD